MNVPAMAGVMRQLRKLVTARREDDCSDQALLQRFVARKDEAAFAALVERHGPMVWGVCRRAVGGAHDAEDAFQGTWLVLARKAGSIRQQASVGSWLHGVAYRVAGQVRAASRRQRSLPAAGPPAEPRGPEADVTMRELLALLDEELRRLPEKCRGPLVLCYLEGQTQDEAARQLGWGKSTLRRRLERGRELLRLRLGRRGVSLPAALTGAGLVGVGAPAAPRAEAALAALLSLTNPSAVGISARAVTAAQGAMAAIQATRLKVVAGLLVAVTFVAGAAGFTYHKRAAREVDADAGAGGANEEVVLGPRQTSPWGPWANGLRCRVTAPTVTEQGMELEAQVELSCDPKRLDRGVKNLNTFLPAACLELTLRSGRDGKVVTVRPHDPARGMLAFDSGEHRGPLTGKPLQPWQVAFPLLQARRELSPGPYECQVRYTFPTEATERWRHGDTKKWDEAGFWRGTAVSGSFRLRITKETTKRRTFLLPKRLRLLDGIKVGFAAEDAEAVRLRVRNGYYLGTYIPPGGYLGGPPEPGRSYFQQLQVSALPDKRVTCSLALFETSQPACHFWRPESAPGYKVLWERTLTLELPDREELLRLHREQEERVRREANQR